jgi:GNAT superfamily N-acetyltransferase
MIRQCRPDEADRLYFIINEAAKAYDGEIEPDCYNQPYMPEKELAEELKRVTFYGYEDEDKIVGVMGIESVKDVTLIRHAYVLPEYQSRGIGKSLLKYLINLTTTPQLLVGTWATAHWAIAFYIRNGFTMLPDKDGLLSTYWDISLRQIETSVVMGIKIKDNSKESI